MSDDTKTIPHSNVITEENTLELMVLVFLVGLGYGFGRWVEMNGIISTSTNTKNTKKKKKKKTSLGPHNCKKIKSQSKSVMDAGGGTGSNPLSLPPSLQEAKKNQKQNLGTVHRNTTYLTKREKDSSSCSPSKEKERNKKNTNTLNMDVACEAIDGLALLYLPT